MREIGLAALESETPKGGSTINTSKFSPDGTSSLSHFPNPDLFAPMSIKNSSQGQKMTWRSTMIWTSCALFYKTAKGMECMDRHKRQVRLAALLWALLTRRLTLRELFAGRARASIGGREGWQLVVQHSIAHKRQRVKLDQKHLTSHLTFRCITKLPSQPKRGVREGRHFSWTPEGAPIDTSLMN